MIVRFERKWERYAYYALVAIVAGMCIACGFAISERTHMAQSAEQSK